MAILKYDNIIFLRITRVKNLRNRWINSTVFINFKNKNIIYFKFLNYFHDNRN